MIKNCAVCYGIFVVPKNAKTAEARTLCSDCKVLSQVYIRKSGVYIKDNNKYQRVAFFSKNGHKIGATKYFKYLKK